MELRAGDRFGRYRVVRLLGRGGMGVVYEAADDAIGRGVALKVLNAELARDDPTALERFRREARAAGAINDPRVVTLLGVETAGPRVALAFELVPGGSLEELRVRSGGRLPWAEAARLAAELARGLAVIHAAGLVHRDVKPHNALLDAAGRLKVSDLGLVRSERPGAQSLSATGELVGTHRYLAPEAQEEEPVGPPADVYGLGVTLFQLLTGRPPFEGEGFAVLKQHAFDRPPPLRPLAPDVPQELEALVLRLLSKEPEARGSAAQVAGELDALRRSPARGRRRRRRVLWQALAVCAVGLSLGTAAALAVVVTRSPPPGGTAGVASATPTPTFDPPATTTRAPVAEVAPIVTLVVVATGRVDHEPRPGERPTALDALSLSFDGKLLVLGGHAGRYVTWLVDARTLQPQGRAIPLAASVADPRGPRLIGVTAGGALVRVPFSDPLGSEPEVFGARPGMLGATVAIDPSRSLVYVSWEGGPPDPVDVYKLEFRTPVTGDQPIVRLGPNQPMSIGRVLACNGYAYLAFHEGGRELRSYELLEVSGATLHRTLGRCTPLGASQTGEVVLCEYEEDRVKRLLQVSAGTEPRVLDKVPVGNGSAFAALGGGRFVVGGNGVLQLYEERHGLLATLALEETVNGEATPRTLLYDKKRRRVVAAIDDVYGYGTRLIAFEVRETPR